MYFEKKFNIISGNKYAFKRHKWPDISEDLNIGVSVVHNNG